MNLSKLIVVFAFAILFSAQLTYAGLQEEKTQESQPKTWTFSELDKASKKPDKVMEFKKVGNIKLKLHFFNPEGLKATDKRPAIVFFFGGGWVGGTPSHFYKQAKYLSTHGMVAVCAEYRIRSKHKTTPKECVMDGKSAIRWVRSHAKELGIDPDKIAAGGGSAGGHVAAATGFVGDMNESTDDVSVSCMPNALVLFNPVYDNGPKGYGHGRVKEYWKQISPMHNIRKDLPPTIVFLGDSDKLIPVETGEKFEKLMSEAGNRCDHHVYKKAAHGFFNRGEAFIDTLEKSHHFLKSLGYIESDSNLQK